ncbi:MAG: hypothetical protein AAGJ18_21910 [Bacteroidota bacterium]
MIFQESGLLFTFSEKTWDVLQYDTHKYYKILSGVGLKGVDFLGIYQKRQVVFWEVKHFRSPISKDHKFELSPDFEGQIVGKLVDSIRAIRVIHQYLERKWWYRAYQKFKGYFPSFLIKNQDWYFWYRLHQLISSKEQMQFVLWLEIGGAHKDLAVLKHDCLDRVGEFHLANLANPVFQETLKVKLLD